MEGISRITDFNSLKQAFLRLDKSGNGHVSPKEAPEDISRYDKDHNNSVELWEYMEAANQETKKEIFKPYEIEANKSAYKLFNATLEYLLKSPQSMILTAEARSGKLIVIDNAGNSPDLTVPFLIFLNGYARLGLDEPRLFDLAKYFFGNDPVTDPRVFDATLSLIKIEATNEDVINYLKGPDLCFTIGSLPGVIDQMLVLGFNKNEILACFANLAYQFKNTNYTVKRAFYSQLFKEMLENPEPILIPGSAQFKGRQIIINYFNRKSFTAVFDPAENIVASNALFEASDLLPEDFFNTFDKSRNLRIIFRNEKDPSFAGQYGPNEVLVDTADGYALSTIVHELAHHWDLNLTVGFSGKQNSAGDISQLYYQISWNPARIKKEVEGQDFGKVNVDRSDFDINDFARDYGMANRKEDIATLIEHYATNAAALRNKVRENMSRGNFELAAKYLFVKYLTPFRGREYNLTESNKGITFNEVYDKMSSAAASAAAAAAGGSPYKSATESAAFGVMSEIQNRAKQGGLL